MADANDALADLVADPLVLGVVHGDRAAWFELTLHVEAWVEAHVPRHWRMRKARLAHSEDDLRDVLLETLERLDRDDFRVLRQYLERKRQAVPDVRTLAQEDERGLTFAAFLARLVDFAIREHVRRRYGRTPSQRPPIEERSSHGGEGERGPSASCDRSEDAQVAATIVTKRSLHSWAVHPSETQSGEFGSAAPGLSRLLTARSILQYAAEVFDGRELQFFQRYLEQATFDELAQEFSLSPEQARAEARKLKERLRARFREPLAP